MTTDDNKRIIRRYYEEVWNTWNSVAAAEILHPTLKFRGSLGVEVQGLDGFKDYVTLVRGAFPDFNNRIDALIAEGDQVVARLTYKGTHLGELFGFAPTGRPVTYSGVAIFRIAGGKIVERWGLSDTHLLRKQLAGS